MNLRFNKKTTRNQSLILLAFLAWASYDVVTSPESLRSSIPSILLAILIDLNILSLIKWGYVRLDEDRIRNRFLWPREIRLMDIVEVRKRPSQEMIIRSSDKQIRIRLDWLRAEDREHLEEVMRGYGYRH